MVETLKNMVGNDWPGGRGSAYVLLCFPSMIRQAGRVLGCLKGGVDQQLCRKITVQKDELRFQNLIGLLVGVKAFWQLSLAVVEGNICLPSMQSVSHSGDC